MRDTSIARLGALALIVSAGAALRYYGLDREALWFDEATSLRFAEVPLRRLWSEGLDTSPPLYYTLQKIWLVFGQSEAALRSLSALLGTLCIPLVYALARSLAGTVAGLLGALLIAASPLHIEYSQEARAYALLATVATLATWGLVRLMSGRERGRHPGDACPVDHTELGPMSYRSQGFSWALYAIGTTAALYAHNTAVLLLVLSNAVIAAWWALRLRFDSRFLQNWCVANVVVVGTWSWWVPVVIGQSSNELQGFWLEQPSVAGALDTTANVYGQIYVWEAQPYVTMAFVALGTWGLVVLLQRRIWPGILLGAFFTLVPTLTYLISFRAPIFMLRTILWPLPAFVAVTGVGLSAVRSRWLAAALTAGVLGVQAAGLSNYYSYPVKGEPWDQVARLVQESTASSSAAVLLCAADAEIPFSYYAERWRLTVPVRGVVTADEPAWRRTLLREPIGGRVEMIEPGEVAGFAGVFSRVWLVERLCKPDTAIHQDLARDFVEARSDWIGGLHVVLFERRP